MINRDKFYSKVRPIFWPRGLSVSTFKGTQAILDEWEKRKLTDLRHLAYMLATVFHETGGKMTPVKELGGPKYFFKMYDIKGDRPALAKRNGNIYPGDGAKYYGRGLPQITWRDNYRRMGNLIGVDLETYPDKALDQHVAILILFEGMLRAKSGRGDFTGKSLEDYFNDKVNDPVGARRVINVQDKAREIAGYHSVFLDALS